MLVEEYRKRLPGASAPELHSAVVGDALFADGTRRTAAAHARAHTGRTYLYEFGRRSDALDGRLGAAHTVGPPFVFDTVSLPALHGPRRCSAPRHRPPVSPSGCTGPGSASPPPAPPDGRRTSPPAPAPRPSAAHGRHR